MLSVVLYIWTWKEFYTITLIHPEFIFFLSKKLSNIGSKDFISFLFYGIPSESSPSIGNSLFKQERETWAIQDIFALNSFSTTLVIPAPSMFFVPNAGCEAEISPKHTDPAWNIFKGSGEL